MLCEAFEGEDKTGSTIVRAVVMANAGVYVVVEVIVVVEVVIKDVDSLNSAPETIAAVPMADDKLLDKMDIDTAGVGSLPDKVVTRGAKTDGLLVLDNADPKFLEAVIEVSLLISTLFTITTSPSKLVTFISTVVVPNPLGFSKKLYVCLVVPCQVLPPSVLTSRLVTRLLAFTTCMLNQ